MKRFLIWCFLVTSAAAQTCSSTAISAFTCYSSAISSSCSSGTACSAASITPHAAGDLLTGYVSFCQSASCASGSGTSVSSVTATNSNTCVVDTQSTSGFVSGAIFHCANVNSGGTVVTVNSASTMDYPAVIVFDFGGAATSSPTDQSGSTQANAATMPASPAPATGASTTVANELIFSCEDASSTPNGGTTIPSGYTYIGVANSGDMQCAAENGASLATYTATWTYPGTSPSTMSYSASIATFKPPGAASGHCASCDLSELHRHRNRATV